MDRNPISDLQAVAAMPGLEEFAAVIAAHVAPGRNKPTDHTSILILLAGRWAFGSANSCDSAFRATPLWEMVRESAASVGRVLPVAPPTFDKLRHLREAADEGLAAAVAAAFPAVAVPLAKSMGLLDPQRDSLWHHPAASRVIYGDGSVFKPLSDVSIDDDDTVQGSRAVTTPRLAPRYEGKDGPGAGTGLPITVIGCHGRERWKRIILGFDLFRDGNEIGASLDVFEQIIDEAGGGVSHVVYDRLMSGTHMRRLMKRGVLPVVAMPEAPKDQPHLVLPAELQRRGYKSAGEREKRKGKGARRRSADDVAPKSRVHMRLLEVVAHDAGTQTCTHELYAVDGAVIAVAAGDVPSIDADYVDCVQLTWRTHLDGQHPIGTFVVPCRHGHVRVTIDFAADRPGKNNKAGDALALADRVRALPEAATYFSRTEGLRSDAESVLSWLKAMLPRNRAGSLDPEHFFLDVIGAALLCNAIAWDVHVSQHTMCAQDESRRAARRNLRLAAA